EGVLPGAGRVEPGGRHEDRRVDASRAADAAGLRVFDRDRGRDHRRRTRFVPRDAPGDARHRGGPCGARRTRRAGQRGSAHGRRRVAPGRTPGARGLRLVRGLLGSGRQHVGAAGARLERGVTGSGRAVVSDDRGEFVERIDGHRRDLHVHCYRMLASFDEAEDAVQETLLRAWRSRATFAEESLRAWLYRIATNVCLDAIRARARRPGSIRSFAEVPWLQPYPDRLLDEVASTEDEPDAVAVSRETVELAFLAALQVLP